MIPEFINKPGVLGIGEIGLNKNTKNESIIFQEHVQLAMELDELILIHTPHLQDKLKGTRMIIDMLKSDRRVQAGASADRPRREHTVGLAKEEGFWCAMTLYPITKCTPSRAATSSKPTATTHHGELRRRTGGLPTRSPSPTSSKNFAAAAPDSKIKKIV